MLQIVIPDKEIYDEEKNEFSTSKGQTITVEHSLVSLSKWESKWCKPFITKEKKTKEESIDYIRHMTLTQNVPPEVYRNITEGIISKVSDYIEEPMTATTIPDNDNTINREIITAEVIYYWMIAHNIPVEFQKWHLNRLLTLINVCNVKNSPPKKLSRSQILSNNAAINAARRLELNTKG